jgi:hypothetical protein
MAIALAGTCVGAPAFAGPPQAITIVSHVTYDPGVTGTFTATGPICPSGLISEVSAVLAEGPTVIIVNEVARFDCDDNSGSFMIRLSAQDNGRRTEGFTHEGPWSVWGKGTGAYKRMSGHGDFGVVVNFDTDPLTGEETYVGFVSL